MKYVLSVIPTESTGLPRITYYTDNPNDIVEFAGAYVTLTQEKLGVLHWEDATEDDSENIETRHVKFQLESEEEPLPPVMYSVTASVEALRAEYLNEGIQTVLAEYLLEGVS